MWGGTFHGVATRLQRLHGAQVGLHPDFTIHGRDSEDLLDLLRVEFDLARGDRRFPRKATCLDGYSRCVNARERIEPLVERTFPWCKEHVEGLKLPVRVYVYTERKAEQHVLDCDDLLLFLDGAARVRAVGARRASALRRRPRGRVPGHERPAGGRARAAPARPQLGFPARRGPRRPSPPSTRQGSA